MLKKLILFAFITGSSLCLNAQVPQGLNYQAIARQTDGTIIPAQAIGIRFSILDGGPSGTIVYQETQQATTNNFGLFTLTIGNGTIVTGTFNTIDWGTGGSKHLKVEIAPQGGTNYTIQGTTQFLSVPYALYAEKTKLNAGIGISITGNTISGNYIAGPGINITGNTISSTLVSNSWLLTGNAGTTAANFLGTTDNQPLNFRVNNLKRISVETPIATPSGSVGITNISDFASIATTPGQLSVFGRDIPGVSMNMHLYNSVQGMAWSPNAGGNNTMGRIVRMSQFTTNNIQDGQFFDLGIDQGRSFFISEHGLGNEGPNLFKKMITITPTDFVGINFNWGETPTANFHTKGTLRFEGINANNALTRVLVMDINGNVSSRDASTFGGGGGGDNWTLTGNAGTTAANFLGTTDNQPLNFRVNNLKRISVDAPIATPSGSVGITNISDFASIATTPGQLSVFGRDIPGVSMNMHLFNSVQGMAWSPNAGGNNTMGRIVRMSQFTTNNIQDGQFFDFGIDQGRSFFISEHGLGNEGPTLFKKMITITQNDFVGINFNWGETPTANFHTKGTARFEGITTNNALTRVMVMDINGNVSSRDAGTFGSAGAFWVADANGIHNSNASGNVAVGTNSKTDTKFVVMGTGDYAAEINSTSNWQTVINLFNTSTVNFRWAMVSGGSANNISNEGVGIGNFGIARYDAAFLNTTFPIIISKEDKVGIGMKNGGTNNQPKSQVHVKDGDVYIDNAAAGVIMKSPNGGCWRITVSNTGTPVFTAITCP
jgi:hypothetical protein